MGAIGPEPDKTIGPYTLLQVLGQGGGGTVFRARVPGGTEVALKLLRPGRQVDAAARERRELGMQRQLGELEGFVPLLDEGESPSGRWLIMPLLAGGSLRQRLDAGRLDQGAALSLATALARAMGRAHRLGVVHRDLKPENVLFDERETPLIADLGLAKATWSHEDSVASLTGHFRGTLGYCAPEQLADAKSVGPAADVFALGAIAYECLSGRPAFAGEGALEVLSALARAAHAPLREVAPDVSPRLALVIERALALDPARRPESGEALAAELEEANQGATRARPRRAPGAADRGPAGEGSPRPLSRAPVLVLGLGLVSAAGVLLLRAPRTQNSAAGPSPAPAQPRGGGADTPLAWVERAERHLEAKELQEALSAAERAIALEPQLGRAWLLRGRALGQLGRYEEALAGLTRSVELDPEHGPAHQFLAVALLNQGRSREALQAAQRAVALDPSLARSWVVAGAVHLEEGGLEQAGFSLERAISLDPTSSLALSLRGQLRMREERWEEAEADLSRSVELDPQLVGNHTLLATVLAKRRRPAEALKAAIRATELSPDDFDAWYNLGALRANTGDPAGCVADYGRALALRPRVAWLWNNRGVVRRDQLGDLAGAAEDFRRAVEVQPSALHLANLARACLQVGQAEEALAAAERGLALRPATTFSRVLYLVRGTVREAAGHLQPALEDYGLALAATPPGSDPAHRAVLLRLRADLRRRTGDEVGARADEAELARQPEARPRQPGDREAGPR